MFCAYARRLSNFVGQPFECFLMHRPPKGIPGDLMGFILADVDDDRSVCFHYFQYSRSLEAAIQKPSCHRIAKRFHSEKVSNFPLVRGECHVGQGSPVIFLQTISQSTRNILRSGGMKIATLYKGFAILLLSSYSFTLMSIELPHLIKGDDMQILKDSRATVKISEDLVTGDVYSDSIKAPSDWSPLTLACVHFVPGARTVWHTHPKGQTLYVTDGEGCIGRRGSKAEVIRQGDIVLIEPNEEHWHGATANNFMAHIAANEVDEQGNPATWGKHVTDEEYTV